MTITLSIWAIPIAWTIIAVCLGAFTRGESSFFSGPSNAGCSALLSIVPMWCVFFACMYFWGPR